jgi:hypothetical protein
MVKKRIPQSVRENKVISEIESKFIDGVERDNLTALTLDDLANRFEQIEQQGQLLQGQILLEARRRFTSTNEFGAWIEKTGGALCSVGRQHRTKLMNLARFFENREIIGISLTACYEISAPINADIADKVYQAALNKNLSVAQIKAEIAKAKGLLPESVNEGSVEPELMPLEDISRFMEQVMADIGELPVNEAIRVLKECEKQLKKNSKTK